AVVEQDGHAAGTDRGGHEVLPAIAIEVALRHHERVRPHRIPARRPESARAVTEQDGDVARVVVGGGHVDVGIAVDVDGGDLERPLAYGVDGHRVEAPAGV